MKNRGKGNDGSIILNIKSNLLAQKRNNGRLHDESHTDDLEEDNKTHHDMIEAQKAIYHTIKGRLQENDSGIICNHVNDILK